jgi:3-isopropylmalate/(R)-2-methylmalate dehydratase small subunit
VWRVGGACFGVESPLGSLPVWGFRVVIAARFADTFRGNALADALLPVEVKLLIVQWPWDAVDADPAMAVAMAVAVAVDLKAREVRAVNESWDLPARRFRPSAAAGRT